MLKLQNLVLKTGFPFLLGFPVSDSLLRVICYEKLPSLKQEEVVLVSKVVVEQRQSKDY